MTVVQFTGVKCGNRKAHGGEPGRHTTVEAVRLCYLGPVKRPDPTRRERHSAIPVYGHYRRGYYALTSLLTREVNFFRVERPDKGKFAGMTFVRRQSGDTFDKMSREQALAVLDAIARDADRAAVLYGVTIGRCYRCHRTLTDPESISLGIGPDCRRKI